MSNIASAGTVLGSRYALDHLVAVGGMGQVWKALDRVLDRAVAVKLLRPDLTDSEEFRRRFQVEARLAARLSHPGIAHVYDYAEDVTDGRRLAFLVMELVDGQPLSDRLARPDRPTIGEVVSVLDQTAEALGAAHHIGIVHRDVKPGNLLITPDARVKITDFGIARAIDSADITTVGEVIGTVRYMSPEQAHGEEATPASDVYSLAVIAYEMLSGRTPFDGDSPVAIALAQIHEAPPPLPASVPAELRSLIARSLAKLPDQRPSDGPEFADALRRFTIDPVPASRTTTRIGPPPLRQPDRSSGMQSTAVLAAPVTANEQPTAHGTLLEAGWVHQHRHRRRLAAWGAALAVAVCLLVLIAINGRADPPSPIASGPSDPAVTTTSAAAAVVTVDPASYLGRTEADARAALTALGMAVVTNPAPSTLDLTGLVLDVQPQGPVATGASVTIIVGDGTLGEVTTIAAADPPTDSPSAADPGGGHGKGKGNEKDKKNRD